MGRMYAVTFENVAVTAVQDLFEVSPADDKPCVIHACHLSQSTDVGDAEEEMLRIEIIRGHTTPGSGGTAGEEPLNPSDAAAGFVGDANNTTQASAGTTAILHAESFNIRTGWQYIPTPETRPVVTQADTTLVVRLMAAPTDSVTMNGTLLVEELG